ncbi:MAG TPA: hypothetical protein VKH37_12445, partial [Ferruginibacter sp.]|nr:hypothetical protein [Ferruginibacter sp.]
MAKNKTAETSISVTDYVNAIEDKTKRDDAFAIIELMKKASGLDPKMWGPSIIGFGAYHYKYASGHEGDAPLIAFSPRKTAIVLYLYLEDERENLLKEFGKYK